MMLSAAVYLTALFLFTVFRRGCFTHPLCSGRLCLLPGVAYRDLISWGSYVRAAWLFFGNIAFFVPLGLWLGIRGRGFCRCLLTGLALSLLIEAGQYLLGTGISETDDLVLNTLGALLGLGLYRLFQRIKRKCEG